uniref:DDE-1 domain-containing protein n=1 Tax=Amphimedon queenslandica TaxID=400682 RepID=A0A1X7SLP9_AMPQE
MDGHSTHYGPDLIKIAAEEQILIFVLPPNTTHLTQPLDKGCFGPLKTAWKAVCHEFCTKNPGRVVTRYDFSVLFADAWRRSMTQRNIASGFEVTGICPFNRNAIKTGNDKQETISRSLLDQTGLAYIPLYSPDIKRTRDHDSSFNSSLLERSLSENDLSQAVTPMRRVMPIESFLKTPSHPSSKSTLKPKSCGRVLTSVEFMTCIEEKERMKQEALKEKERKRIARLENQKEANRVKELKRSANFTMSEHRQFSKRFENGYDIPDERYELWVQLYRPNMTSQDSNAEDEDQDSLSNDTDEGEELSMSAANSIETQTHTVTANNKTVDASVTSNAKKAVRSKETAIAVPTTRSVRYKGI